MNPWTSIKRRLTTKNAKAIKKKAFAGAELVGAGAALTAMLLEEMVKSKEPQVVDHDNICATDNGATYSNTKHLRGRRTTRSPPLR